MVGGRVIVQSSLAMIPTYTMQTMALPSSTCKDIDKICRNFLFGHSDDSRKICKPRNLGGLDLRKAKDFNLAFLTKMARQALTNEDKLWVKILKEKYIKEVDFLNAQPRNGCSWGWRYILKGKPILEKGVKWKIGTGTSINFWHDWWMGETPLANVPNLVVPHNMDGMHVNQFNMQDRSWYINAFESVLPINILNSTRATPTSLNPNLGDT